MTHNFFRPILAILLLFIPLYPKFPLSFAPGSQVAFRLDDIVILAAAIVWLIYQTKRHFPILKSKITWIILTYFIAIILSTINAILVYQITPTHLLLLHLARRFEYLSVFFITLEAIKHRSDIRFVNVFTIIAFMGVFIYGMGQKYFHFPIISTMNFEFAKGQLLQMDFWSRISATFAGHYDLAIYLSVVSVIFFGLFLIQKNLTSRFALLITWLMSFYLLTLTAARISVFAYWGGITLLCLLQKRLFWIVPTSLLVLTSIANSKDLNQRLLATIPSLKTYLLQLRPTPTIAPPPPPTAAPVLPPIITKIKPTPALIKLPTPTIFRHRPEEFPPVDADAGVARSGQIRFNAEWPRAITAFNKNRLFGTGMGSITLATDNDYLRSLGETGLLGFLTFASIFIYLFLLTLKAHPPVNRILFTATIITLINATFIDVFEASKTAYLFWIMMAIYYRLLTLNEKN